LDEKFGPAEGETSTSRVSDGGADLLCWRLGWEDLAETTAKTGAGGAAEAAREEEEVEADRRGRGAEGLEGGGGTEGFCLWRESSLSVSDSLPLAVPDPDSLYELPLLVLLDPLSDPLLLLPSSSL